jgi:endonuclease IV
MVNVLHKIHPTRTGTVVHIGAKGTIENVCTSLNDMDIKVPVLMENCAETSKLGRTIDELRKLIEGTDSRNVGICLDTCHCYAGGMCDFSDINQVEKLFEDISFTHNRRVIFHANDSLCPYNGRIDRHSHIGYGHIWNINRPESIPALERYYELSKMNCNDIIFETPNEFDKRYENDLYDSV